MNQQFKKETTNPLSTRQEIHSFKNINNSALTYTLCDRTDLLNKKSNYFVSFNLPHNQSAFPTGHTLSLSRPELQQLNVDQIVISNIPSGQYNEIIDGRSITVNVPQKSGSTGISAKTLVSSTYSSLEKSSDNQLLGPNIAFLFSDDINLPYSGTIRNCTISRNDASTWNPVRPGGDYVKRPYAVSYTDLRNNDINTDDRSFSGVNLAVNVPESYPNNTNQGYNYDVPVGFVALDKGFFVFTHPDIVNNIPWTQGFDHNHNLNTGSTSSTTEVYFSSNTNSSAYYTDIDIQYKTSVICIIMPGEFYKSTNPTYNLDKAEQEEQAGTYGMDPVYISEIALHNSEGEIIAFAKLDRPFEKYYHDFITFNIDLMV